MSAETEKYKEMADREKILIEATVKYWWQRRRFIAVTMVLFVAVFAAILFVIPKSYRAQASIIIMPPRFIPETRTQPLTIITAQSLLQTNELYQQVRLRLQRYRNVLVRHGGSDQISNELVEKLSRLTASQLMASGELSAEEAEAIAQLDATEVRGILEFTNEELAELSVDRLADIFYSEEAIEKKTASDIIYSPVLQLFAITDSGNKAQVLVNLWARLFEQKYESLTRGQTQKLFDSLENQQIAGQEELENIQKVLVKFSLENNLELIQRQVTEYGNSFTSINKLLVTKKNELLTLESKVESLHELLNALEGQNFSWLGSLFVDVKSSDPESLAYVRLDATDERASSSKVVMRRRWETLQSRQDLIESYEAAATFNSINQIELLEAERKRLEDEYLQEKTEYRLNLVKAEVAKETLMELNDAIAETSQSVSLYTALPDEILGEALTADRAGGVERVTSIHLNKEQLNPLWETLVKQRAEVSRNLHEAEATVAELAKDLPTKEEQLRKLGEQVYEAKQAEKLVDLRVDRNDRINQELFSNYASMKEEVFSLGWELTMLQDEVDSLEESAERSREMVETLRSSYEAASAHLEVLELRKKAVVERAELLTQKLQESTVAVGEEVSDISMASKAVAPTRHFFPPRTILLFVMALFTAGVLLTGLSRKRYRELMAA